MTSFDTPSYTVANSFMIRSRYFTCNSWKKFLRRHSHCYYVHTLLHTLVLRFVFQFCEICNSVFFLFLICSWYLVPYHCVRFCAVPCINFVEQRPSIHLLQVEIAVAFILGSVVGRPSAHFRHRIRIHGELVAVDVRRSRSQAFFFCYAVSTQPTSEPPNRPALSAFVLSRCRTLSSHVAGALTMHSEVGTVVFRPSPAQRPRDLFTLYHVASKRTGDLCSLLCAPNNAAELLSAHWTLLFMAAWAHVSLRHLFETRCNGFLAVIPCQRLAAGQFRNTKRFCC